MPGCQHPPRAWHPLPPRHGAVGSYWEALGSQGGASVPCSGRAASWGPLGHSGGLVSMGQSVGRLCPPPWGVASSLPPGGHWGWPLVPAVPCSCGWPACGRGDIPAPRVPAVLTMWGHAPQFPLPMPDPPSTSPKQLLQIPPLAHRHIWAGLGGGGWVAPWGGDIWGHRTLPGGTRGPESARGCGMKEVVARVTAPEPGRLPRAAGSCAGWRRHGGAGDMGGVG